jgi:hypothetical protein
MSRASVLDADQRKRYATPNTIVSPGIFRAAGVLIDSEKGDRRGDVANRGF